MNVVLVGEEAAGIQTLRRLPQMGHRVAAVLASPKRREASTCLWNAARALGYSPQPVDLVSDPSFADWMRAERVDVLLNVHSLRLIRGDVLGAPRFGSFNLHPGPLPRYAGLNSVCWAIYHGETVHGVTLHHMAPEVDAGAIAYQAMIEIGEDETGLTLSAKCVREGLPLVFQLLAALADPDSVPNRPQDLSKRTFFGAAKPQGGELKWSATAREIVNFVRAADFIPFRSPWGHPTTLSRGRRIGVARATVTGRSSGAAPGTVTAAHDGAVEVAAADDWVLVTLVEIEGRYVAPATVLEAGGSLHVGLEGRD